MGFEMHHAAILHQVGSAYIRILGKPVGHHGPGHGRNHFRDRLIIQAKHRRTVKRQMVRELQEGFLQIFEAVFVSFEMIPVNVGDQGDDRLKQQERAIAFICLRYQVFTLYRDGHYSPRHSKGHR